MPSQSRRIVFVSCPHVGSTVGLWPEEWETEEGVVIRANKAQLQIYQYWQDFASSHEVKTADSLILLGDLCQGKNPKDFGLGTMTPSLHEQKLAAISLIKPIAEGRPVFGVSGSQYHDSIDLRLDRLVLNGVGGQYLGYLKNTDVKGPDVLMNLAHGNNQPAMYKGSFDDREIMLMSANGMTREIDLVVRGHWHYYHFLDNGARAILRVPGWQCWYPARFMIDLLGKKNNKLGAVVLDINRANGRVRYQVHPFRYEPPLTWGEPVSV